ncbi:MAG TPA: PfkB family carbohydrate kinase [Polyangiaceae bacterium]|nr:PfkB family carbohydrate kinase [Polyangiaceae bacterium]
MSTASPVLIIGSMALDDLHLPSGSFPNVVGGAATFASVAASLFAPARIVGVVGDDFPEQALDTLRSRGVDTAGVQRIAGGKTFKWVGKYADNLQSRETLDTQLNVFADFQPELPAAYRQSKLVLLGNIHPALQLRVLSQLDPGAFVVADTMNFWISGERALLSELLTKIDLLTINDEELRELAGVTNLRQAAEKVLAMGPRRLIVKKGEHGALLFDGPELAFVPAYPLELEVDPTGAGDSFAGSLLGRLAQLGRTDTSALRDALVYATAVASFNVEGVGLERLLAIDNATVAARIAQVRSLVRLG